MKSRLGFGYVSPEELREAELFFRELHGDRAPRPRPPRALPQTFPRAEAFDAEADAAAEETMARVSREAEDATTCPRHDRLPTVKEAICWGEAYYRFVPITTRFTGSAGEYRGTFWVLDDALKWLVPASFTSFVESYDPMTDKVTNWTRSPSRRRLWRLPCSPRDAQESAELLTTGQADLSGAEAEPSSTSRERSLLLTPDLYDERYGRADLKIAPQTTVKGVSLMTVNQTQGLAVASNEYNTLVNEAAHRISHTGPARGMLADPGKIWALTNTVGERYKPYTGPDGQPRCRADPAGHRATPNYGWHTTPSDIRKVIQSVGNCHNEAHIDYSQVFVVVAGWCEVTRPSGRPTWTRTAEVYQSDELHRLVTRSGKLRKLRYDWI